MNHLPYRVFGREDIFILASDTIVSKYCFKSTGFGRYQNVLQVSSGCPSMNSTLVHFLLFPMQA
jgi:hypothetical protein